MRRGDLHRTVNGVLGEFCTCTLPGWKNDLTLEAVINFVPLYCLR